MAYHSAKRVTNDLAFNQTMQKKSVLPRDQNVIDLMQLASWACARHCEQFGGHSGHRTCNTRHGEYVLTWRVMTVLENEIWLLLCFFCCYGCSVIYVSTMQKQSMKNLNRVGLPPNKRLFNVVSSTPFSLGWMKWNRQHIIFGKPALREEFHEFEV